MRLDHDHRKTPVGTVLPVLMLLLCGCTVSFAPKLQGRDGSPDANLDASLDASGLPDAQVEPADAAPDGAVILDAQADAGCPPGTKWCDTTCVSVDSPGTGCAADSCEPCVYDHASALCVGGACALGVCENLWGNCDTDPATGCETDLRVTTNHCGSCPNSCSLPNANMTCVNAACQFQGCVGGYQDCDGNLQLNGCETNTGYDNSNCGSCGNVCYSGFNCNNNACRCSTHAQCDTGGGGICHSYYKFCECPGGSYTYCYGPCNAAGTGCLSY